MHQLSTSCCCVCVCVCVCLYSLFLSVPCQPGLKYTECTPCSELRLPPTPQRKGCISLNCYGKAWVLGSVEYPFIAITPRSTLTQSGCTCLSHLCVKLFLSKIVISHLKSYIVLLAGAGVLDCLWEGKGFLLLLVVYKLSANIDFHGYNPEENINFFWI